MPDREPADASPLRPRDAFDAWGVPLLFFFVFLGVGATQPQITDYARFLAQSGAPATQRVFGREGLNFAPLLVATIYLVFIPSRFLGVWAISRWGRAWTMRLGTLLYLGLGAALWWGRSPWALLAGCASIGTGAGLLWTASATHVLDYARAGGQGSASGVFYALAKSGMWLGTLLFGALVAQYTYAGHAFFPYGPSAVLGAFAFLMSLGLQSRPVAVAPPTLRRSSAALRQPQVMLAGGLLFFAFFGYGLFLAHLMPLVQERLSSGGLPFLAPIYFISGMAVCWPAAALSDRFGRWAVMFAAYACGGASMLLMAHFTPDSPLWLPAAALALLGVPFGAVPPTATALVGDVAEPGERPLVYACVFLWRDLGAVSATLLTVALGRAPDTAFGFRVMAAVFLLPLAGAMAAGFRRKLTAFASLR